MKNTKTFGSAKPTFSSTKLIVNRQFPIVNRKSSIVNRLSIVHCTLLIVFCFLFSATAWGQQTLLVHNGSETNGYVPVYGFYADAYLKCEFVYPASELSDMAGGTISSMTFYLSSSAAEAWTGTFDVYMEEIANATISNFSITGSATNVYTGTLNATGSTMNVEFDNDYIYNGGNLLVGFYLSTTGNYKSATFSGETVSGASVQGYSYSSLSAIAATQRNFLPKTTFTYTPPSISVCQAPTSLTYTDVTDNSVTLRWIDYGTATQWWIFWDTQEYAAANPSWRHNTGFISPVDKTYTITGLNPGTNYRFRIFSVCGEGDYRTCSCPDLDVTTPCPTPTDLAVTNVSATTASLDWTGTNGDYVVMLKEALFFADFETTDFSQGDFEQDGSYPFDVVELDGNYVAKSSNGGVSSSTSYMELQVNLPQAATLSFNYLCQGEGTSTFWDHCDFEIDGEVQFTHGADLSGWQTYEVLLQSGQHTLKWSYTKDDSVDPTGDCFYVDDIIISSGTWSEVGTPTESAYTINNLSPETTYLAKVKRVCEDCESNESDIVTFTTLEGSCPKPISLTAGTPGPRSVQLNWTAQGTETQWQICVNGNESNPTLVSENPYTLEGLTPETTYTVKVRAYCDASDQSNWSNEISFTTDVACPAPTGLTALDITDNSAELSWTGSADSYNVRYSVSANDEVIFFDGFESGTLDGWTIYTLGDEPNGWRAYDASSNWTNHGGNYSASSFSWYGSVSYNANNWLISPQVTLQGKLKFWVYSNFADEYEVLLSTTGTATDNFTIPLQTMNAAPDTWTEVIIDLSSYSGQGYIAIHHVFYDGNVIFVDDFGIYSPVWVETTSTENSIAINGLTSETEYEWQVQSDCGSDGESNWSTIATFTTLSPCATPTGLTSDALSSSATLRWSGAPENYNVKYGKVFYEDFENGIPATWTTIDADGDENNWLALSEIPTVYSAGYGSLDLSNWAHAGSNAASSASYVNNLGSLNANNWLITPQVDLGGALRFYVASTYEDLDSYEVLLSTTGTATSDFNITLQNMTTASYGSWDEVSIDLSSYAGQQGYIAIHHVSENMYFLVVDDFRVYYDMQTTTASTRPFTINGLEPETDYAWQVQGTNCDGNGGTTDWSDYGYFTTLPEYTISASVEPTAAGTITGEGFSNGSGVYTQGTTCTLTATADDCHTFENWTENDVEVSSDATYSFTVTGNRTLVANFTLNSHTVTVNADEGGSASQDGNGTYTCGSTARLTATPDACYNFSHWTDGNGGTFAGFNPIEVTVDHDITFTAHFTLKTYTVTTSAIPSTGGSVTGGGTVNCGEDATLTATPSSGYYFYQWNDGNTDNPRTINNITSNVTYTATFKQAPLIINNTTDWNNFAEAVSHGYTYSGETVTQTADITVTTMVGGVNAAGVYDENFYFNGTFNGGCNTITFNKANATEQYTAPFRRINGATIQNVKVAGTVSSSNRFAGGVVAYAKGTSTLNNCINSTSITSTGNTHGGIVGMVGGSGTINITGCVFDGTMSNGTDWSGILGLNNTYCTANIRDCLFIPESVSVSSTSGTMLRNNGTAATVSNCYYTQTMTNQQGTRVYSVTGGTGVEVSMKGSASTTYSCSGLDFYTSGLTFNGTIYGSSLALSLGYEGLISGYTTSSGELSGTSHTGVNDEYTLASLSGNAIINQNPCPFDNPPAGLIWKGGTDGDITNWEIATNWAVYNESESRYQLAGSAPSESSDVFIVRNDACNIVGVPSLSSNEECNDITLSGINVNIAEGKYLTINGTATFTSGIVTGDVIFDAAGSAEGANINSYVDGTVTKNGNDASFIFPTGSDGVLGTITASIASGQSATAKFNHKSGGFDQEHDGYPRWWNAADMCGGDPFNHISNFEYWDFNTTANLTNVTFESKAASADAHFHDPSEYPTSSDGDIIQIAVYNNCWQNIGGHLEMSDENRTITISGVNATRGTTRSGSMITSLGSKSKSVVLPIELTSFTATCDGRSTLVEWSTATERNNDYFVIERSDDAIEFTEVGRVAGAGNSIEQLDYTYNDYGIHGGDNYYRLVQVDYDGTRTVSEIVVANCVDAVAEDPEVMAYPNPFNGELTIVLDNFDNRPATIEVYDMLGQQVLFQKAEAPQNSYETILNLSNLPPAAYTVRVSTADFVINKNVVKN